MAERPKQRWGCLQWGCVVSLSGAALSVLLVLFAARSFVSDIERGSQIRAIGNCKQIVFCLRRYAIDHESRYPHGLPGEFRSSNQVFRELYRDEIASDERIFGCPASSFNPDNEMGRPPKLDKTLGPGECHWMLLKNQTGRWTSKPDNENRCWPSMSPTLSTQRLRGLNRFVLVVLGRAWQHPIVL